MMYLAHFGLAQPPFKITPHTEFFFTGANRGATLDALIYTIRTGDGLVKVTGEVGSGKTMLCRVLAERLPENVETIYLAIPSLTRDEILQAVAADLKLKTKTLNTSGVLQKIQDHLIKLHSQGRQVVVELDDDQGEDEATETAEPTDDHGGDSSDDDDDSGSDDSSDDDDDSSDFDDDSDTGF